MAVLKAARAAPRVRLLDGGSAPVPLRPYFVDGDPGPITASLAHLPDLLPAALSFLGAALGASWFPLRFREIVILRMSALSECMYCTAAHTVVALDSGLSDEQVRGLRGEVPYAEVFDDASDRAIVLWCDAVHSGTEQELAVAWAVLGKHFDDGSVVELTVCATATLMLNRYATALQLPTSPETLARLAREGMSA